MSYTPPSANAVNFDLADAGLGYVPPVNPFTIFMAATAVESITENIEFSTEVGPRALIVKSIVDQLALSDVASRFFQELVSDTLALSDSAGGNMKAYEAIVDAIGLADAAALLRTSPVSLTDVVRFSDVGSGSVVISVAVSDTLSIHTAVTPSGESWTAWVANLATNAHSKYEGFAFNSFAQIGGKWYGAREDGIYELDGQDDGGTPITWTITLPKTDFNSELLKRMGPVYLGVKADGAMVLKVVTDKDDVLYYNVTPVSDELNTVRVKIGKGAKYRYWAFELVSDSSSVELESITFLPAILTRRI